MTDKIAFDPTFHTYPTNNLLETIAVAITKLAADQAEYLVWAKARDEEALQMQRQHLDLMLTQEKRWKAQDEARAND